MSDLFQFGSIKIPRRNIDADTAFLIPKSSGYIPECEDIEEMLWGIQEQETKGEPWNTLIVGEPGCGKSALVEWICAEMRIPLILIQGDGEQAVADLIGYHMYREAEGGMSWEDGKLPFSVRRKASILYDEINHVLPEVLSRTHSMLDYRRVLDLKENKVKRDVNGGIILVPEQLNVDPLSHFWATMNPHDTGRHVGTKPLSPALESRFNIRVRMGYLSDTNEVKLLTNKTSCGKKDAEKIVEVANKSREAFRNMEISMPIDHRMTMAWAALVPQFGIKRACKTTIINKLHEDDMDALRGLLISLGIEVAEGRGHE